MRLPPPDARSSGVLFEPRAATLVIDAQCSDLAPKNAPERRAEILSADHPRLFGFESELEASLTYIPMAVRFKLDKCGIKLSLGAWQQLPEDRRREFLRAPCDKRKRYRELSTGPVRFRREVHRGRATVHPGGRSSAAGR